MLKFTFKSFGILRAGGKLFTQEKVNGFVQSYISRIKGQLPCVGDLFTRESKKPLITNLDLSWTGAYSIKVYNLQSGWGKTLLKCPIEQVEGIRENACMARRQDDVIRKQYQDCMTHTEIGREGGIEAAGKIEVDNI